MPNQFCCLKLGSLWVAAGLHNSWKCSSQSLVLGGGCTQVLPVHCACWKAEAEATCDHALGRAVWRHETWDKLQVCWFFVVFLPAAAGISPLGTAEHLSTSHPAALSRLQHSERRRRLIFSFWLWGTNSTLFTVPSKLLEKSSTE